MKFGIHIPALQCQFAHNQLVRGGQLSCVRLLSVYLLGGRKVPCFNVRLITSKVIHLALPRAFSASPSRAQPQVKHVLRSK